MAAGDTNTRKPGVYFTDKNGVEHLVCWYQGGEFGLGDIPDYFQLGELDETRSDDETALVLTRRELRTLKTMARYGLVSLKKGPGGKIAPRVPYTDIVLDVPVGPKEADTAAVLA